MKNVRSAATAVVLALVALGAASARAATPAEQAKKILNSAGMRGGLIVHVGCGDGKLTAALRINDSYLVHGLDSDSAKIKAARQHIHSTGRYGKISVDTFDGKRLGHADNSVNLIVMGPGHTIPDKELLRALAPRGVALIGDRKLTKPVPADIDDWSHWCQGPQNNPVARDTVVGPPRRLQWVAGPRWLRSHGVPS